MKLLFVLLAVGSIALIVCAILSPIREQARHAFISSVLHQMQSNCPTADFNKSYEMISNMMNETAKSYTNFVLFGLFGLGLSIAGFVSIVWKRKEIAQQHSDEPNSPSSP